MPALKDLKPRPGVLLPYAAHDGMYAGATDCGSLSLGWAQWDSRTLALKTLRHTGARWSRQSEELPLHRILDEALLIAAAVGQGKGAQSMPLAAGMLEQQDQPTQFPSAVENDVDRRKFESELHAPLVLRRRGKLADTLIALRQAGRV